MHFSTAVLAATMASTSHLVTAMPFAEKFGALTSRMFLNARDTTETVLTDGATVEITVKTADAAPTSEGGGSGTQDGTDAADAIVTTVNSVVQFIQSLVDKDISRRQQFTQQVVARVRAGLPKDNVIMSNVGYSFTGTTNTKTSTKYKAKVGSDVSYDVITFSTGTFTLEGDGGYENWAYIVDGTCKADGKTITC